MMHVAAAVVLGTAVTLPAQFGGSASGESPAIAMPQDRVADSYAIYSSLLPLGETATWKGGFFAVQAVTVSPVQPNAPCMVPRANTVIERAQQSMMNPHSSVTPPANDRADYEEILTDFDSHCHDRYTLDRSAWTAAKMPVRLLNDVDQNAFQTSRTTPKRDDRFAGAVALYSFSPVYFNAHGTVALVYATHWCGMLCGQGFWIALRKQDGTWKQLRWQTSSWIS